MGLDSIWDNNGNYLTKKSKGFSAKTTGCGCCSAELNTEDEVRKEAISSLSHILRARDYFKWNTSELIKLARVEIEKETP